MSKYTREPKSKRRTSDGAISTQTLSPALRADGGVGGAQAGAKTRSLSFFVDKPNTSALDHIAVGEAAVLAPSGKRITVRAGRNMLGLVPVRLTDKVRAIVIEGSYRAWISEIAHRSIRITMEW